METVIERVRKVISSHLDIPLEKVTESARFIEDLGADSLDAVELTMALEDEFGCEIPDELAENMHTVADVRKYIESKAKA